MTKTNGSNPQDAMTLALKEAAAVMAGNKVKAWVQITVTSDQFKRLTAEVGISESRDIPDGAEPAVIRDNLIDEVKLSALGAANEVLEQLRAIIVNEAELTAAIVTNTPYVPPKPVAQTPQSTPQTAQDGAGEAVGGKRLQYAPKAAERVPGDWWEVDVNEYKLTADKLEFWKAGNKYPEGSITPKSRVWPEVWIPHMLMDGSHQPFGKTVRVRFTVSDKKSDKTNTYYINCDNLTVLE